MTARRLVPALGALAAAALVVACGGSKSAPGASATATATGQASPQAQASAPMGRATPYPTPQVNGRTYTFAQKGYAIDVPAGWLVHQNEVFDTANARFPTDAFFSPATSGGIQPSISIVCLKPRTDQATTDAFRDAWKQYVSLVSKQDVAPLAVTVDGKPAYEFNYTQPLPEQTAPGQAKAVAKSDVVLVAGGCRWMVTLTAPVDANAPFRAAFDQALASLKFQP